METEWCVTVQFRYNNTIYICVNVCKQQKHQRGPKDSAGIAVSDCFWDRARWKESTVLIDCT